MIGTGRTQVLRLIWGIVFIWLFFGSLAFAEQLNLLAETSNEDEEVLSWLASSLKPAVPSLEGPLISPVSSIPPSPVLPDCVSPSLSILSHDRPALRPHQRLSVYRI